MSSQFPFTSTGIMPQPGNYEELTAWAERFCDFVAEQMSAAALDKKVLALDSFTVADAPNATQAGLLIYVTDEVGGATVAYSNGTNWLRVTDGAVIS